MPFLIPAGAAAAGTAGAAAAGTAAAGLTASQIALGISAAVSVAGGVAGAIGARQQGKAAQRAAEFNAQVSANNAIARRQEAQFNIDRLRARNKRLRGKQVAAAVKSGVRLSGSVLDVIMDSNLEGELDILAESFRGALGANASFTQSALLRAEGASARSASKTAAAGSLLSGFGSAAGTAARLF